MNEPHAARPGDPVELEVLRAGSETPVAYRAIYRLTADFLGVDEELVR